MGKKVISLVSLNQNNNLPPKICYEKIVKNVVDVALFFHNTFIFICGQFQYDIYCFILTYKKLTSQQL